ncbi:MAG: hypothetical protein OFPII_17600 [Osedax symbiont Rs1]|nr:MAG: hypothetical protein OFPII_17600 [Osedax symbiont Rs1]
MQQLLNEISQSQHERLVFIDFCLEFFGQVNRAELIDQFSTASASSTRDFTLYKKIAANNLTLVHQTKCYYRTANFKPVFKHPSEQALAKLCAGYGSSIMAKESANYCFDAIRLIHPRSDILAQLMRAISARQAISCDYVSLSSGAGERQLVPHALVNNGHRWHVRAFDRKSAQFRDFVCRRFLKISLIDEPISTVEEQGCDQQWQSILPLQIIPHPNIAHSAAIELDYAMLDGMLELPVRAAIVGYLTQQWRIDCSKEYRLDHNQYHLALKNRELLEQIDQLNLIPGARCEQ